MDNTKHKFELLKMARELLNEEYINRRAQDHNKWIAECDVAWKTRGIKLPYPPFAPYPTEAEIIAKASSLYTFLKEDETANVTVASKSVPSVTEFAIEISKGPPWNIQLPEIETPAVVKPVEVVEPKVDPVVVPDSTVTTVTTEKVEAEPVIEKPEKTIESEPKPLFAMPSWLQKTQK